MRYTNYNPGIKFLLITNGLILIAGAMLGPIYALFVEGMGGDLMDASIAGFAFAMTAGVVVLLVGKKTDQIQRKEYIVARGYALMGIGFLSYIWTESMLHVFIVQIFIGIGEAVYSPAFDALFSMHLDEDKEGEQWGTREALDYFTGALGALLGGYLVTKFGFESLFLGIAGLCFLSVFLSLRYGKRYLVGSKDF